MCARIFGYLGYPFFGRLILDALNDTETAMTQAHIFRAAEISMKAQMMADSQSLAPRTPAYSQ